MHTFHATATGADGTLYVMVGGHAYRASDYAARGIDATPVIPAPAADSAGPATRAELIEMYGYGTEHTTR